jgi:hypothetical protein
MELFPVVAKKLPVAVAKIPCPSGTGNLLKTIVPELKWHSPIADGDPRNIPAKIPCRQGTAPGHRPEIVSHARSRG